MPFTPFHMGPALMVKAASGRHFSLTMFGVTQVAMDLEPLVRLFRNDPVLHGHSHSYLGATVIAGLVLVSSRPLCRAILRELALHRLGWLTTSLEMSWFSAASGAFLGAYSHVLLDSMYHLDIRPLWPISDANALVDILSTDSMHLLCVLLGALGGALWLSWSWRRRHSPGRTGSTGKAE